MEVILTQPMTTWSFWAVWSFQIYDDEAFGNQIGAICMKKRLYKRLVGNKDSFLLLTPFGTSKGPENVDTG